MLSEIKKIKKKLITLGLQPGNACMKVDKAWKKTHAEKKHEQYFHEG